MVEVVVMAPSMSPAKPVAILKQEPGAVRMAMALFKVGWLESSPKSISSSWASTPSVNTLGS